MPHFEAAHGEGYITADIESPLAKVKVDIHQIPFPDQSFDVVLCNHVLEHVRDDRQAMREIARVLKPGGWAILQVPFFSPVQEETVEDITIEDPRERERRFGQDDHVRKYGRDYVKRISSCGLVGEENNFAESFTVEAAYRAGISRAEMIYTAKKP